jgi:hypothetical protein
VSGGTEENHEKLRIAGLQAVIWTPDFPNTKQGVENLKSRLILVSFTKNYGPLS